MPPRPELIRDRYAKFFRKQTVFLERYKELYLAAMNQRFGISDKAGQQK